VSDNVGWASPTSQVFDLAVHRDAGHAAFVLEGWVFLADTRAGSAIHGTTAILSPIGGRP